MKRKKLLFCSLIFILLGCSTGGDNTVAPIEDLFIPDISNQWASTRGTFFFFNPDKTNVNASNFTGQEEGGSLFDTFAGKFKDYDVQFTFNSGADSGVTYSGKFVKGSKPLQMQLKGTNGVSLTLTQSPPQTN